MAADILVIAVVAILIILAARYVYKNRKKGIGPCGYNCSDCPSHGGCGNHNKR